jgi:hypothetical protein
VPNTDEITPAAAQQLCDMMRPEVGKWRDKGTTVGKVSFNGAAHNWAARNGGLKDVPVRDRKIVDTVTVEHCPDVRQQVLDALAIPDSASGLAGFHRPRQRTGSVVSTGCGAASPKQLDGRQYVRFMTVGRAMPGI